MNKYNNMLWYIISYPFNWVYDQLEYLFYVYILPMYTGLPTANGWNPKYVRKELILIWDPTSPINISYKDFINSSNDELKEVGFEVTKGGHLRRIVSPQMYYANPEQSLKWGDNALKWYLREIDLGLEEYRKELSLDPFGCTLYVDTIRLFGRVILSYNIQSRAFLFRTYEIDIIDILLSIIVILFFLIIYIVFYHLKKLTLKNKVLLHFMLTGMNEEDYYYDARTLKDMKEKEREEIIAKRKYALEKIKQYNNSISANEMNEAWREGRTISPKFYTGIEIDYCFYEFSCISSELCIIMFIYLLLEKAYALFHYYIYTFYILNMELFTYVFVYLFGFLSVFFWLRLKKEKRQATHRWVEVDHYVSHFLNHFFRTLCWLNLYKLVCGVSICWYVFFYILAMLWIYFGNDSCDYFMGWNQDYRIDIYYNQTRFHMWWPRSLMNQTWHHFYITLMKPIHTLLLYILLYITLPFIAIFLKWVYYQNKIHVYINNKFFFWNSKKYTIDEIKEQWKKDRIINYIKEEEAKRNREKKITFS